MNQFVVPLGVIAVVGVGVITYAIFLQRRYLALCREQRALPTFAESPAGLPKGTIRAMLALFIVVVVLSIMGITLLPGAAGENATKYVGALMGVLGTVLGFYFGNRGAGAEGAGVAAVQGAVEARTRAENELTSGKVGTLVNKVRDGLNTAKLVASVLPGDLGRKAGEFTKTVERGLATVDALTGDGKLDEALGHADRLIGGAGAEHPITSLLKKATGSLGGVLSAMGSAVPAIGLIMAVVSIGSRLGAAAQKRWTAEVMRAPYTPELFSPDVVDVFNGLTLMKSSPVLDRVFRTELQGPNYEFVRRFMRMALSDNALTQVWEAFGNRFADQDELEAGLQAFHRGALRLETLKDLAALPKETIDEAGGIQALMATLDKVNDNPDARADLDEIMLAVNRLKKEGHNPETVFRENKPAEEGAS